MNDTLGARMKSYEAVVRGLLMPHSHTILRVDGRAFHSYLRRAEKPYDFGFMKSMKFVGETLCKEISGTVVAYGQSDEISLLLSDLEPQSQPWFGGVIQKMASVAAAIATAALITDRGPAGFPHFDARVFTLPPGEVANYFIWRQRDAVRNSISMLAQSKFTQKQLHGVNSGQMQELLFSTYGINWDLVPDDAKRGWLVTKNVREATTEYVDKRTGETVAGVGLRTFWEAKDAPNFNYDNMVMIMHGAGA